MNGPARTRPPAQCTCTHMAVATLAGTLGCPYAWRELPGGGWAHVLPPRVRGIRAREPAQETS